MCERQWKPFLNGETFNCYIRFLVIPLAEKTGKPSNIQFMATLYEYIADHTTNGTTHII